MSRRGPWGAAPGAAEGPPPPPPEPSGFPCPSCGATLGYQPGATHLACAFCGAEVDVPQTAPRAEALVERDFAAALAGAAGAAPTETARVLRCAACGAETEVDATLHAATCPFCAAPVVADPVEHQRIRPQALLPFALDAREAQARLQRWLGGLWFAPSGLARFARREGTLTGVYAPYWTFDARTETVWTGQRGDVYTQMVAGPKGQPRTVTRVRWSRRSGRFARGFDDVLAIGSAGLPRADAEALAPWDLSALRPYARDWLAGFRAEAYTIDLRAAWTDARGQIDAALRAEVRAAIGGDQQRIDRMDVRVDGVTFKHVLLPVWIGAYRFRGRAYRVVINGRTGAVRGRRPWSAWKIALAVLGAAALAALVAWVAEQGRG